MPPIAALNDWFSSATIKTCSNCGIPGSGVGVDGGAPMTNKTKTVKMLMTRMIENSLAATDEEVVA